MFINQKLSLTDILGDEYTSAVAAANEALGYMDSASAKAIADEKLEFFPEAVQKKNDDMLAKVGTSLMPAFENSLMGAGTDSFMKAASKAMAPLAGFGCYRLGENGKLYLIGKSEHYHTPLGHRFPAYDLIDNAKKLNILNATHNNTRGYITRLMETRLVQSANGIDWDDDAATEAVLSSREPKVLNRVINLETGSLAVEAGVKMMLSRFYKVDNTYSTPKYSGRIPVFFVMGDREGGIEGNYHGTTVLTQTFRGLWPDMYEKLEAGELYKVVPVSINDIADFEAKMKLYNEGKYKTAGFLHEIILMNYGGIRLTPEFLRGAYAICKEYDTPTLCDEIQSCMWYKGMFLFRLYELDPDFVIIGKGFPGGEYPASRIITTAEMDTLVQFGALVTNGQEELASLAYLITMTFMRENGELVAQMGAKFDSELKRLHEKYPNIMLKAEGLGHLAAIHFKTVDQAAAFASKLKAACIDASAQTYKANCPPAVLLKPPVISTPAVVDHIISKIDELLGAE